MTRTIGAQGETIAVFASDKAFLKHAPSLAVGGVLAVAALWANRAALASGVLVFLPVTFVSACI